MNSKYIALNLLKIPVVSQVCSTSESVDIFNTWDEIFLVFTEIRSKFSFSVFFVRGENITFFLVIFR